VNDFYEKSRILLVETFFFLLLMFLCIFGFSSCTFSINTLHTQGTATDLIDEVQKANAEVDAEANIP
jgi:hypothetical protein